MDNASYRLVTTPHYWLVVNDREVARDDQYFWEDADPESRKRPIVAYVALRGSEWIGNLPRVTIESLMYHADSMLILQDGSALSKMVQWVDYELKLNDEAIAQEIVQAVKREMLSVDRGYVLKEDYDSMSIERVIDILERHNLWRRGADDVQAPTPKEIGEAIDTVVDYLKSYIK